VDVDQAALLQSCQHWACSAQEGMAALLDGVRNRVTATYFLLETMKRQVQAGVSYTFSFLDPQPPPAEDLAGLAKA
jgi:hypothetical protein